MASDKSIRIDASSVDAPAMGKLDPVVEATKGTAADKPDMFRMGKKQELRVGKVNVLHPFQHHC